MSSPSLRTNETASDIFRQNERPLVPFFSPNAVAVIGATETPGSVGRTLLWNLISSPFGGPVFPVNPKRASVLGIKAYPSVLDVPSRPDLAVVITPSKTVPGIIRQCAEVGVKAAIVISAGFKELGPEGAALEQQVVEEGRRGGLRIVGPNCLGIMCPPTGLNAAFGPALTRPGKVAFISQSGALGTSILDWCRTENVGLSAFVSIGSMADVGWGDLIDHLGNDPYTQSIVIYMETIGDARSFLSAAREVALAKPIIVIKAGRTAAAAKAAASHTGSLTGSDEVLDTAFRRCGVLRVTEIGEMFDMAAVLGTQPAPKGNRLTIVTNAGGPGVLATDELVTGGGELAPISSETIEILNQHLPAAWSHSNPIDVLGDAPPERYAKAIELAAADPNSDGLLVVLTPQSVTDPLGTAEMLKPYAHIEGKPILSSWIGGAVVAEAKKVLGEAGIPTFDYPDRAARVFNYMTRYRENLNGLYETPSAIFEDEGGAPDRNAAAAIVDAVRQSGRTVLTEMESKELLATYGIPTTKTVVARSVEEAVAAAEEIGYPVVLKIFSETITHKTDVGGVQLNIRTGEGVRKAYAHIETSVAEKVGAEHFQGVTVQPMIKLDGYEIILGSSIDSQFGPVLLFGAGGQLVEVFRDSALALPPLTTTLARRMMERTKIYRALKGVRGRPPADLDALERLIVRFSLLSVEQRWIREIDINPLMVSPDGLVALDARVVVYDKDFKAEDLPKIAVRPYPHQYVGKWTTRDGLELLIRPIRPEDEPLIVEMHKTLSEASVYMRYFHAMKLSQRVAHDRLLRICHTDYAREIALVAEMTDPQTGKKAIIGVARLSRVHGTQDAEFSLIVNDAYHRRGIGTELLRRLLEVGRDEKVDRVMADVLPANYPMQRVCDKLGFEVQSAIDADLVKVAIRLQ